MGANSIDSFRLPDYDPSIQGVRTLSDEAEQNLTAQLDLWSELGGREVENPLKGQFASGDTTLPSGTLIHGIRSASPEQFESIATNGVVSGELFGIPEDAETHYCADFFKVPETQSIADYTQWASETEQVGAMRKQRMERPFVPTEKTRGYGVSIIVGADTEGMDRLSRLDAYSTDPDVQATMKPIINQLPKVPDSEEGRRLSAILGGVPANMISGLLISRQIMESPDQIDQLRQQFGESMPIIGVDGNLLSGAGKALESSIGGLALR